MDNVPPEILIKGKQLFISLKKKSAQSKDCESHWFSTLNPSLEPVIRSRVFLQPLSVSCECTYLLFWTLPLCFILVNGHDTAEE